MTSRELLVNLCNSIKLNNIDAARDILIKNPEIFVHHNSSDLPEGMLSPLWEAMIFGREEICDLLIGYGVNVNERYSFKKNELYGFTFLQRLAFLSDNWEIYKKIAETLIYHGANVNVYFYPALKSPLLISAQQGNLSYAEFLLKNGARIELPEKSKNPPISLVLNAPKILQAEMLKLLLNYNFDINLRHNESHECCLQITINTAVQYPGKINVLEIATILLNSGLSVHNLNKFEEPTLFYALSLRNPEMASLLIKRGSDVNLKSKITGGFPVLIAADLNDVNMLELLLSSRAEINAQNNLGWTALHAACWKRCKEAIVFLIQKGALMNLEKNDGKTQFACLEPQHYKESDVPCITVMIKEIAKLKFSDDSAVLKKDLNLIESHQVIRENFQSCMDELDRMSSTKFYAPYSNYCVYKLMKNNVEKLAKLTKNEEFVSKFTENLTTFTYYQNDLQQILVEAILVREELIIVESKLKTAFCDFLPDVVLKKLADNLSAKDLQLVDV